MDRRSFLQSVLTLPLATGCLPENWQNSVTGDIPPSYLGTIIRASTMQGGEIGLVGIGPTGIAAVRELPIRLNFIEKFSPVAWENARHSLSVFDAVVVFVDSSWPTPGWAAAIGETLFEAQANLIITSVISSDKDDLSPYPKFAAPAPWTLKKPACTLPANTPRETATSVLEHICLATLGPYSARSIVGVDQEDVRWVLGNGNQLSIGFAQASESQGVLRAVQDAVTHPLLGQSRLSEATGILAYIEADPKLLKMRDIKIVMDQVRAGIDDPLLIFGAVPNAGLANRYRVTLVASQERKRGAVPQTDRPLERMASPLKSSSQHCEIGAETSREQDSEAL